jgi:hypothetical protein
MADTIVRAFDHPADAMRAIERLEAIGVDHDDISFIANNREGWHDQHKGIQHDRLKSAKHDKDNDGKDDRGEGASKGATTGGVLGAGAGLLAGLGMLAIPGLGPVVAAGWLASTATGAAAGAVAGGLLGGLVGALTKAGVSKGDAEVYAESVRRGGALVVVRNPGSRRAEIEQALSEYSAADATHRRGYYEESGWRGYDEKAPELSDREIEVERTRYRMYVPRH